MLRNKKGVALSLNTLIIAILVIVVLVVIVGFFLFGFQGLSDQIKNVFYRTITGTDRTLAMQNCEQYCDQAEQLNDKNLISSVSAYCNTYFNIDEDGDGEAEYVGEGDNKKYVRYYCYPGVKGSSGNTVRSLQVSCYSEVKVDNSDEGIPQKESIQAICQNKGSISY